ncbi:forkhead box protein J1-A-like [Parambassis ranga]|uniref:Forkhead box protein J1-A-like n=1 Tax=Parambassis ranga TaxID=210632 RepID=A0A6P7IAQ9_9TELE|nr:forkhead box protein J1-A-like [Parambassis ranga]
MGGVDLSDQLIQYYSTHRKTARWYKTILLHLLDIATTNAYILHREMSSVKEVQPMTQKDFMVELVCQLCGMDKEGVPQSRRADHIPVAIVSETDPGQKATKGRLKCRRCLQVDKRRSDTPWKFAQAEERDSVVMDNSSISSSCSSVNQDDSLTSLQWLQEFSIPGANVPQHAHHQPHLFGHQLVGSNAPSFPLTGDPASIRMPLTLEELTAAAYSRMQSLPRIVAYGHCPDEVDYKTNAHIKPPYSYATLICMAMQASKESKFNLPYIYKWITDNFCYYRHSDSNWQNSIRCNLSFNKCFIKVPRQKGDPGKGGFWKIDPHYAERLLSGTSKHRRMPPVRIHHAFQNSLQPQSTGPCSTTGVQEGLCINPESQQRLPSYKVI